MLLSSRSDARFEVAGSADTVLNTFMDHMNVCFCFDGLVRVFEEGIFDLWSLDPAADDYQPHPYASAFFYMGHLIRNRVGHEIEEDRWNVVHLMGICSRGMASPHVEVRRAALLCLVDISKQWTLQQDGFWARIGDMLSPSQLHLLQAYVAQ
ncbi:hypothetical protein BC830DRAFT_775106 [Chytriomyces sp. MP71]|nr:hypothetical protein BC830DRAFT_775106 [Chytriomyces sp. MP71]